MKIRLTILLLSITFLVTMPHVVFAENTQDYTKPSPEVIKALNDETEKIYKQEGGRRSKEIIKAEILKKVEVKSLNDLAIERMNKGNFDNAKMFSRLAIESAKDTLYSKVGVLPEEAMSYHILGDIARLTNNPDEALKYYKKAIEINPMLATAYFNIGLHYIFSGEKDEGVRYLDKSFELDPSLVQKGKEMIAELKKQANQNK